VPAGRLAAYVLRVPALRVLVGVAQLRLPRVLRARSRSGSASTPS